MHKMRTISKKRIYPIIAFICYILFACSPKYNESEYFNGTSQDIKSNHCISKQAPSKILLLEGTYYGIPAAYDSLILFHNPKLKDKAFNINNINNLEEVGTFCEKGIGPNESVAFSPIYYFFKEGEELKTHLFAPNERKLFQWNITQSIQSQHTYYDTIIPFSFREKKSYAFFQQIFRITPDTVIAKVGVQAIGEDDATLPFYQKLDIQTGHPNQEYRPFRKTIANEEATIIPEAFYYTYSAIKPDKTLLAEAMRNLPQVNIINLRTGEIKGFRIKGGEDFSIFKKKNKTLKIHFCNLTADDNYIYAIYCGKNRPEKGEDFNVNTIYIFNWEGELKYRLTTDCNIFETTLDSINNRLYMSVAGKDEVRYIELNEVIG